jgi:hypothetical protein
MGRLTSEQRQLIREARSEREHARFVAVIFKELALARSHGLPKPFGGQRRWYISEGWQGPVATIMRHEDGTRTELMVDGGREYGILYGPRD